MTYEQAGHSEAGRAIRLDNGDTLTLMDRIDHHHTTALATIEVSSKNAGELVKQFSEYFKAAENTPDGDYKTYVIKHGNNPGKVQALCDLLDKHRIEYGRSGKDHPGINGFDYINNKNTTVDIDSEDLIISVYQPKSVLTQVLFEPEPFVADSLTYDITAWALPYAYGLDAYALNQKITPSGTYNPVNYKEQKWKELNHYAYLATWGSVNDARFLKSLLEKNITVRVAKQAFEIGGQNYGIGTLVINRGDNKRFGKSFDQMVQEVARKTQKSIEPLQSGLATQGADLGSDKMHLLQKPEILVVNGDETSNNEFGQVWYFFDQVLEQEVTIVGVDALTQIELDKYNVLVLPEGNYKSVDESVFKRLEKWVKQGGKLIIIGYGLRAFKDKEAFGLMQSSTEEEISSVKLRAPLKTYDHQDRKSISNMSPGAIYKIRFDNTHPLGYGFPSHYFSLKNSNKIYPYLKDGWNVGYIDQNPTSIGFVGANVKKKMKETTVFGVESMEDGKVIYMVDNPLFRGFWEQGKFLFCNAVYMVD